MTTNTPPTDKDRVIDEHLFGRRRSQPPQYDRRSESLGIILALSKLSPPVHVQFLWPNASRCECVVGDVVAGVSKTFHAMDDGLIAAEALRDAVYNYLVNQELGRAYL